MPQITRAEVLELKPQFAMTSPDEVTTTRLSQAIAALGFDATPSELAAAWRFHSIRTHGVPHVPIGRQSDLQLLKAISPYFNVLPAKEEA
jgi:hypothetical protein